MLVAIFLLFDYNLQLVCLSVCIHVYVYFLSSPRRLGLSGLNFQGGDGGHPGLVHGEIGEDRIKTPPHLWAIVSFKISLMEKAFFFSNIPTENFKLQ